MEKEKHADIWISDTGKRLRQAGVFSLPPRGFERKEGTTMDIMSDIAATSMSMHQASLQQDVSLAVTKKVMDTQELAGQEMLRMLPEPPRGEYIDTYA